MEAHTPEDLTAQHRVIRSRTLTRLRWFAVLGQLLVVLIVRLGFGFSMPIGPILLAIGAAVWVNLYVTFSMSPAKQLSPRTIMYYLIFDTIQIGTILFLTGGVQNPFAVWLILPAMLAAASLDRERAAIVVVMVVATLTLNAFIHQPLPWEDSGLDLPWIYDFGTWLALMLGVGFTSSYAHQVSHDQMKLTAALETTQRVLAREERLTALGGLAAAAAHELGTPLGTILVTAREMEQDLPEGPLREDAQLLISQTQRCHSILQRLANLGVTSDERHNIMSLDDMLREAAKPFLTGPGPEIEFAFDPKSEKGPPDHLQRKPEVIYGLRTLIENGVKFANEIMRISARWDEKTLTVTIEDDGPGFTSDVLTRLGEPYPRAELAKTAPSRKQGLGLGFFIAKTLLERSGARIGFGNGKRLSGAWVEISWPLAKLEPVPISKEDKKSEVELS